VSGANGNGSRSTPTLRVVRADEPLLTRRGDFATRRSRARWFWARYREFDALPLWWVAREWLRSELRYLR
jgi:hypothetical protein